MNIDTQVGLSEQRDGESVIVYRPNFSHAVWEELATLIEPALEHGHGEYTMEHLHMWLRAETANLWGYYVNGLPTMGMITSFVLYPHRRYLHVMALGGKNFRQAMKFWSMVETFMQCNDCTGITAYARPQMARLLQRYAGFEQHYAVMGRWVRGVH